VTPEDSPLSDEPNSEISFDDLLKLIFGSDISPADFLKLLYDAARRSCRNYRRYYNEDDMEDLAQSIALSLIKHGYRGLRSFKGHSSAKAWLQTVADRETLHFYSGQRTAISLEDLSPDDQAYPPVQFDRALRNGIARRLTKSQRELLELMLLGLRTNEIAECNGINPDSVSRSKSRLLDKIDKLLKSSGGGR
jgi:RNA polymerase sigma factor (sigma-70 family)